MQKEFLALKGTQHQQKADTGKRRERMVMKCSDLQFCSELAFFSIVAFTCYLQNVIMTLTCE
jgi:hypothetical protein